MGLWVGMCVHLASKAKAWAWVALGGQQRGGIRGEAWSGRHPRKMGVVKAWAPTCLFSLSLLTSLPF